MPLLRLQLACPPRRHRPGLLRCRLSCRSSSHFAALAPGRTVCSIFFGGGTPSLMAPETVGAILDRIAALWTVAPDAEITLEANPTSVEAGRFAGYRAAGVNRVSLGVQSLDDASLKALGRKHTSDEALAALAIAKRNFERVSFDLIYARQGQELQAWREELARALTHAQDHLSLYQLTIEEGTPFAALHAAGALRVPEGAKAEAFYLLTQELCDAAGLPSYEVSNHARPGAESRHNLLYWRGHDYAGVGPGAHSRITLRRRQTCHRRSQVAGSLARSRRRVRPRHRAGRGSDPAKLSRRISADGAPPRRRHRREAARCHRRTKARRGAAAISPGQRPRQAHARIACRPPAKAASCSTG